MLRVVESYVGLSMGDVQLAFEPDYAEGTIIGVSRH